MKLFLSSNHEYRKEAVKANVFEKMFKFGNIKEKNN
jgi:hypothetical protein